MNKGFVYSDLFIRICSSYCLSVSRCQNLSWSLMAKLLLILQTPVIMGALDLQTRSHCSRLQKKRQFTLCLATIRGR